MTNILGWKNFRKIINDTFKIYSANYLSLIFIAAIIEINQMWITYILFPPSTTDLESGNDLPIISIIFFLIVLLTTTPIMWGALIHAVSEYYIRKTIDIRRAYLFAWWRYKALVGTTFIAILAPVGILIIVIILAKVIGSWLLAITPLLFVCIFIFLYIRWIFIWQIVLLEGTDSQKAFSRSAYLVTGNWWRIFGTIFILGLITGSIGAAFSKLPIIGFLGGIVLTPLWTIVITLIYFNLRGIKEDYTLQLLAKELNIEFNDDIATKK